MKDWKEKLFWRSAENHLAHWFFPSIGRRGSRVAREVIGILATAALVAALPLFVVLVGAWMRGFSHWDIALVGLLRVALGAVIMAVASRLAIMACAARPEGGWIAPTVLMASMPISIFLIYAAINYLNPVQNTHFISWQLFMFPIAVTFLGWLAWVYCMSRLFRKVTSTAD
jgi:hypothetical protein